MTSIYFLTPCSHKERTHDNMTVIITYISHNVGVSGLKLFALGLFWVVTRWSNSERVFKQTWSENMTKWGRLSLFFILFYFYFSLFRIYPYVIIQLFRLSKVFVSQILVKLTWMHCAFIIFILNQVYQSHYILLLQVTATWDDTSISHFICLCVFNTFQQCVLHHDVLIVYRTKQYM